MRLNSLPADADDATRLAYAAFGAVVTLLPIMRSGATITDEGWKALTGQLAQQYGQGGSEAAQWIRDSFAPKE